MEQTITFKCQEFALEGRLTTLSRASAAIITHPHPQYGGDMDNTVVATIAKAYQNKGWSTLRFNFRGAGNSQGSFDSGIGEIEDVTAAIACLVDAGFLDIELAGYSFGAWVLACRDRQSINDCHPMRFVAPPVDFLDFRPIHPLDDLRQVIVGSEDEFGRPSRCESLMAEWNPKAQFKVIEGTDHFFGNRMDTLRHTLEAAILKKI